MTEEELIITCTPGSPTISTAKKVLFTLILYNYIPLLEIITVALITLIFFVSSQINLSALTASIPDETPVFVASVQDDVSEADPIDVDSPGYVNDTIVSVETSFAQGLLEDATRQFYLNLVGGNYQIVQAVYDYGERLNKDLIFAQMEAESGFDPQAFNNNIDRETGLVISTDRGLFQLNSKSYPNLTIEEFFNIEINVRYGIAHLRSELEYNKGNVRHALWTYNAGRRGILNGVPARTIVYASNILDRTKQIAAARNSFVKEKLAETTVYSSSIVSELALATPISKH